MTEKIKFGRLQFKRNGVLASGILGITGSSMAKVSQCQAGGITSKSISKEKRKGHDTPVIQVYEAGLINAVGLSSSGILDANEELKIARQNSDAVIIASIFGSSLKEFQETIELLDKNSIDAVELNISCPNVEDEFGLPFSSTPEKASSVVKAVRNLTSLPVIVKLSPNFPNIGDIAKAVEGEGADAVTAINTVGPGMLIDINTYVPKLTNKVGGISGPAILPIAVRCIYDIYEKVKIPIIGMGGITTTEDALQAVIAGAALYGIGTGILYKGLEIFSEINKGIDQYLNEKKMNYNDLIGIAHRI